MGLVHFGDISHHALLSQDIASIFLPHIFTQNPHLIDLVVSYAENGIKAFLTDNIWIYPGYHQVKRDILQFDLGPER